MIVCSCLSCSTSTVPLVIIDGITSFSHNYDSLCMYASSCLLIGVCVYVCMQVCVHVCM